jgi:hypothetical protein
MTNERESWKYCSRCNLAEEVKCPGRSLNCNVVPVTKELISSLISKGASPEVANYMKENGVMIQYDEPGKETIIYGLSKEPTEITLDPKEIGLGNLVHEHEFRTVEGRILKGHLEQAIEKSMRFAS